MLAQNLDAIQQNAGITALPSSVGELISNIFKTYIFYAAGIGLLIYLISGGFQLMTSRGDPKAIEGAKGKITNALLGFFIVILAVVITQLVGRIFGVNDITNIFGGGGSQNSIPLGD